MEQKPFYLSEQAQIAYTYRPAEHDQNLPLLIFVNGLTQTTSSWLAQSSFFKEHFPLLFFDFLGQGRSTALLAPYSLEQHADNVIKLIAYADQNHQLYLNQRGIVFIAFSFGSRVVLELCFKYFGRKAQNGPNYPLKACILIGSSYAYFPEQKARFEKWLNFAASAKNKEKPVQAPGGELLEALKNSSSQLERLSSDQEIEIMKNFFRNVLPDTLGAGYLEKHQRIIPMMEKAFLMRNNLSSIYHLILAILDGQRTEAHWGSETFHFPSLLLRGNQDPLCLRENLQVLQKFFVNSEIDEIADSGHTPAIEQAEAFNLKCWHFLKKEFGL